MISDAERRLEARPSNSGHDQELVRAIWHGARLARRRRVFRPDSGMVGRFAPAVP